MLKLGDFANPEFLWLLLLLPMLVLWRWFRRREVQAVLGLSSSTPFEGKTSLKAKLKPWLYLLRILGMALLIIGMARPQTKSVTTQTKTTQGIDIVLAIDVSSSMLARDLTPNRLTALKGVAGDFIRERVNDRIGIVVYSGESFTKTPITSDKSLVLNALEEITYGQMADGTAIGMGLATAVNRLKDSEAKSKVIILLTDGMNNAGFIEPMTASELAVQYGIRTYTIGVGTNGKAQTPVAYDIDGSFIYDYREVEIDEKLLETIASQTGGKYFRATDNQKLNAIYDEINSLERSDIEELTFSSVTEHYRPWILLAVLLISLEAILGYTLFRSVF